MSGSIPAAGARRGDSEQSNKCTVSRVLSAIGRQGREEEEKAVLGICTDPALQRELMYTLLSTAPGTATPQ